MPIETDQQISARIKREKSVRIAWRQFYGSAPRNVRKKLKRLPPTGVYRHES
jgi:hypothetical protein